jgi:arylsulfatase A-like enzyme
MDILSRVTLVTLVTSTLTASGALVGNAALAPSTTADPVAPADQPNIVFILTDDLDAILVAQMRNVRRLAGSGVTFDNSFVADSLCCPSRAATLTGMFPHNTGVRLNTSKPDDPEPSGGYPAFAPIEDKSFAVNLQEQGYHTGFMGKYMNQYPVQDGSPLPPGWDQWNAVGGSGYAGWKYKMAETTLDAEGRTMVTAVEHSGLEDDQYVQTVLGQRAVDFIDAAEASSEPYFLEIAPYATHSRVKRKAHPGDPEFPPALQDRPSDADPDGDCGGRRRGAADDCSRLNVRDFPGFDQPTEDNAPYTLDGARRYPGWLPTEPLAPEYVRHLNRDYRNRARMAQSVDRIVRDVVAAAEGEPTYIVFTSDNGFRLGQFRLGHGKGTPYTPDIDVPLVVGGSAVPAAVQGTTRDEIVLNIDLAPTFEEIAGARPQNYHDGTSLLPLLQSDQPVPWRTMAYIEHVDPPRALESDPDQEPSTYRTPTYWAVRTADALFVESKLPVDSARWQVFPLQSRYAASARRICSICGSPGR